GFSLNPAMLFVADYPCFPWAWGAFLPTPQPVLWINSRIKKEPHLQLLLALSLMALFYDRTTYPVGIGLLLTTSLALAAHKWIAGAQKAAELQPIVAP